jgi:alkylation response protein AidB-like acyl-CoA dehydrogenase
MSTEELEAFRAEVKAFLREHVAPALAADVLLGKAVAKDDIMAWHRKLYQKGWVAPGWPKAFGGTGWTIAERWVFEEEAALAGAPPLIPMGLVTVGPILIGSASDEQQARYLPRILDGQDIWCQGFSEPGAGSDLASLQCRAEPVDGGYRIEGTKIWTTQAHWSDLCLLLARTSAAGRPQEGITMLVVDMTAPGVSVRPIITLDGLHVLNQVFFDAVFVPHRDRIGVEGRAWDVLKSNIGHERVLVANPGFAKALRTRLMSIARRPDRTGRRPIDQPRILDRIVLLDVRLRALEATALRVLGLPDLPVTPEASLLKIRGTELQQAYTRLIGDILGEASLPYAVSAMHAGGPPDPEHDPITPNYLFLRKASISAGTNEVQRDIIARNLLR